MLSTRTAPIANRTILINIKIIENSCDRLFVCALILQKIWAVDGNLYWPLVSFSKQFLLIKTGVIIPVVLSINQSRFFENLLLVKDS